MPGHLQKRYRKTSLPRFVLSLGRGRKRSTLVAKETPRGASQQQPGHHTGFLSGCAVSRNQRTQQTGVRGMEVLRGGVSREVSRKLRPDGEWGYETG